MTVSPERIEEALERTAKWDSPLYGDGHDARVKTGDVRVLRAALREAQERERKAFEAGTEFAYKRRGGDIRAGMDEAFSEWQTSASPPADEARQRCPYCGEQKTLHQYASPTSCVLGSPPADGAKR